MNAVCLASPSYRYAGGSNIYQISGVSDTRIISKDAPQLKVVLRKLILDWYDETFFSSSVDSLRQANSLAKIANFGHSAVPALVTEISRRPSYLFLALERIVGLNLVSDDNRGDVEAMCGAWVEWYQNSKSVIV